MCGGPDGVSLAYQVIGGGSRDLVFFAGLALPIDLLWEDPGFAHFADAIDDAVAAVMWSPDYITYC